MNFVETPLTFECEGDRLFGIAALPERARGPGVVIVVGGPQYRAGSHRQFVQLARRVAAEGHACLRFDVRGKGDSEGAPRSFEQLDADIRSGIDALMQQAAAPTSVVLWGLCDGASAALLYVHRTADSRVAGLALLNPWIRSTESLARVHVKHYYRQRLLQREFWAKLVSRQVAGASVTALWRDVRAASGLGTPHRRDAKNFQSSMARGWSGLRGKILLVTSEHDLTAQEFLDFTATDAEWQRALAGKPPDRVILNAADHTCSTPGSKREVEDAVLAWLQKFRGSG